MANYRRPQVGERIVVGDLSKRGYKEVTVTRVAYSTDNDVLHVEVEYDSLFGKKKKWINPFGGYSIGFLERLTPKVEQNV